MTGCTKVACDCVKTSHHGKLVSNAKLQLKNAKEVKWIFWFLLINVSLAFSCGDPEFSRTEFGHKLSALKSPHATQVRTKRQSSIPESQQCGQNITVTTLGGRITSQGYPNLYPSNEECSWYLRARGRSNITLKIMDLHIESSKNCRYDYLSIYAGPNEMSPLIDQLCGEMMNTEIRTKSREVFIKFKSDPNYEEKGFYIEYQLESLFGCKSTVSGSEGIVTSPNYPEKYPDSTDCWTLITTEGSTVISLQFDVLDLEFDESCAYDFVEVFDGRSRDAPSLGKFCSEMNSKPSLLSTRNALLVHFHSDDLLNNRGFSARFSTNELSRGLVDRETGGCSVERGEDGGTITSPNYPKRYPSEANCVIKLEGSPGQTFSLKFDFMQIEIDENCTFDRVEVYDGFEPDNLLLGKFCSSAAPEKALVTKSNKLLVKFISDDFSEFTGFKATYKILGGTRRPSRPPTRKPQAFGFRSGPRNATVLEGDVHVIQCKPDDPNAKISWVKDDHLITPALGLTGLKAVNNHTLWIKKMNPTLVGKYGCLAISDKGEAIVHGWITMRKSSPQENNCNLVFKKRPLDLTATEGEHKLLQCDLLNSTINITWEVNGKPLTQDKQSNLEALRSGHLFINNITPEDGGVYTCIAKHRNGCVKKVAAELIVIPRVNVEEICGKPRLSQPGKEKPHLEDGKIVGGATSKLGAYPWQVMLWEPTRKSFCGATLLNERWILTAAHCFRSGGIKWQEVRVYLGKYDQTVVEDHEVLTSILEPPVIHPDYSPKTFNNDIALVYLKDHINFTDYIVPACLGNANSINDNFFGSRTRIGTVTGWGQIHLSGPTPKKLREIKIPIVEDSKCRESTRHVVTKNMFCAGYAQEIVGDACKGDSGGPFVVEHNNRWYIIGIVSWGEGCAEAGKYGFYTKVTNYHSWIRGLVAL